MMQSCLYRGPVRHLRKEPEHRFQYQTAWAYLDLEEIDELVRSKWLFSDRRFAPLSFRRSDHFGDPRQSMTEAVRGLIEDQIGTRWNGPIRLLTQFSHFGVYFSPLNVFYCFDSSGVLQAMVEEVSNTPWNERHCYLLWEGNRLTRSSHCYSHPKEFHVSPFMGMDSRYHWRVRPPGEKLHLSLGCEREGNRIFHADLHLNRSPLTETQLARSLLRRPIAAAHVLSAIYFQALRLWIKKCRFYPHPNHSSNPSGSAQNGTLAAEEKLLEQG